MNCPRHIDASAYIDNMLPAAEQRQFDLHLHGCAVCRQRVADLTALRQHLRALPSPVPGFDMTALIEERVRGARVRRRQHRPFWGRWAAPGLAAAASLASGIWLGGLLGGSVAAALPAPAVRVFDPVPPGGLCAAVELCRAAKGLQ